MNAERRLAKLEGALSPKAATLCWLAEAHQFPTLPAYVAWLVDQPAEAAPLWRVPERAETAVRAAMRGEPRTVVEAATRQAVRDAVFLVELVLHLNVAAAETVRVEGPRPAALVWELRAITAEAELAAPGGPAGRRLINRRAAAWRDAVLTWLTYLDEAEGARVLLERRYLDGRSVLFASIERDWAALRRDAARLAELGDPVPVQRRSESRKRGLSTPAFSGVPGRQAEADAASVEDEALTAALNLLGDTVGATGRARRLMLARDR